MKMKRLLALLLALVMVFSLFACGDDDYYYEDDDDDEKSSHKSDKDDDDDEEEGTDPTGDATDPTGDATEPTEGGNTNTQQPSLNPNNPNDPNTDNNNNNGSTLQPEEPTEPETSNKSSLGTWNGITYINEYAGFQITFDNTWTYMAANQLQTMPDTVQGMIDDTTLGQMMALLTQVMDMSATNNQTGNSTNIVYQNIPAEQKALLANCSDEEIVNFMLLGRDLMGESYAAIGIQVTSMDKVTVNFLGQTRYALKTTATYMGINMYFVQLVQYNLGEWSVTLTANSYFSDSTQDILNMYRPL